MSLTEIAIKRPSLVVVVFTVLSVLGFISYTQLKYELLPKIDIPTVTITTVYPGASPSEVENLVTKKIEDAISTVDLIDQVKSTSTEGISAIVVQFQQGANVDLQLQETQRKVNSILSSLPDDANTPTLNKFATDDQPILRIGATANMEPRKFYQLVKDQIVPKMTRISGVGAVTLEGGQEREIQVNTDVNKLRNYNLSIGSVSDAINAFNQDFPTGKIKDSDGQFIVRIAGKFTSLDQIRNLVISRTATGSDIKVKDVAEVNDGAKETTTITRVNGLTSIGLVLQKQSDANSVEVSKKVRKELGELTAAYKTQNMKFDVAVDTTTFTVDAADAVQHDLMIAIILVAAVMLVFLHSLRDSLIVMVAIPASLIATCIMMFVLGYTLNLMTLLGLSLVIGILVDDSIVVLENIHRHLEMGEKPFDAALNGRNEIGFTALSITFVDVVVFLPLVFVSGLVGDIMREFAVVVVTSTLLSLFVSFTITPTLAARFSRLSHPTKKTLGGRFTLWFEGLFHSLQDEYARILRWCLRHKAITGFVVFALFVGALALPATGFIGGEFIERSDQGQFVVTIEKPAGTSVEQSNLNSLRVERLISRIPEVKKIYTKVGASSEGAQSSSSSNNTELTVTLIDKKERKKSTDDISLDIKRLVADIPGAKVRVNPVGIFGSADQTPIQLNIKGTNYDDVKKSAQVLLAAAKKIKGSADVRLSTEDGKPEVRVIIDREKLASFGLTLAQVGQNLRTALTGNDDSKYREDNTDYDIRIQLDGFDRSQTSTVNRLTFRNPAGKLIELQQFADVYQSEGPTKLERTDRNSSITLFSQVIGRPQGDVSNDLNAAIVAAHLPVGVSTDYTGNVKNQSDSNKSLGLALLIGIFFVYLIMVALYDSYVYPFVVLFSIPVALIGAMLALAMAGKSLTIFSILGLIMLLGLVAKNAILLVDFANHQKEKGANTFDALIEAGRERIRPILMTTIAMVFGMLPIALSSSSGSEWKTGLAWALIGGLTSSMILTLVVVPVVYMAMDNLIAFVNRITKRNTKQPVTAQPEVELV